MRKFLALLLFVVPLLTALPMSAQADESSDVRAFVEHLTDRAISLANDKAISEEERKSALGDLLKEKADYRWIAGFTAGAGLKQASEAQRARYFELYPKYLVKNYLPKFKNYAGGAKPVIEKVEEKDGKYVVKTRLKSQNGSPLLVNYRIRQTDGGLKIYDVVAEGVSLIVTQRAEFSAAIQRDGMDGFLNKLQSYVSGS